MYKNRPSACKDPHVNDTTTKVCGGALVVNPIIETTRRLRVDKKSDQLIPTQTPVQVKQKITGYCQLYSIL